MRTASNPIVLTLSPSHALLNERGIAMLTVVMILILMTMLGFTALTLTAMENQGAGLSRTADAAATVAESCLGAGIRVVQQTILDGDIPNAALDSATPPGPVPAARHTDLLQEIIGQADQDVDSEEGSGANGPDLVQSVGTFSVTGDIDRLYLKPAAGGSTQFGGGTNAAAQVEIYYRVSCRARRVLTGTTAHVSALYACTLKNGDTCQRILN